MVHDVVVRDVVEEKATHPAQEVAVDCRRRAALVVPFRLAIVGQFRVSVVQIRDHDEPEWVRDGRITAERKVDGRSGNGRVVDSEIRSSHEGYW